MNFQNFLTARRKGVLLAALASASKGVEVGADLLHRYCVSIGLNPTRESIDRDLEWLAERKLVNLSRYESFLKVSITQDGLEVVAERTTVAGVDISEKPGA